MREIAISLAVIVIVICGIYFINLNFTAGYKTAKKGNLEFEKYLDEEIYGSDLATIINRAMDSNKKNNVQTDESGFYIDNNENSISIEIKMTDKDSTYKMERFYNSGIQKFLDYYSNIKFKCVAIKYHNSTGKVKYMLFNQITE